MANIGTDLIEDAAALQKIMLDCSAPVLNAPQHLKAIDAGKYHHQQQSAESGRQHGTTLPLKHSRR